jgi:glycosyltransferase involved in cell wall biosynthesis
MRALVRDIRPDVVHAHGYKADVYAFAALRKTGTPLVSTCHTWYDNDLATRLYGAIDRRALRGFNAVVAVSTDVEARLLEAGLHPARIRIIMNGVDTGPFDEIADRRCYSGSSGPRLRIGLIGRLAPEKGVDIFLSAAAKVLEHADVDFVIAGDGPERTSLQAHINSLHLGQRVRLLGQVQAMPAFLGGLDILASASRQEGLPMALLEGMASGLPIAATAVGTVPGVVLHQQTGLLVPPENADALAEALLALVQSAKMREDLGRNARSLMLRDFSAERMTDDYLSMYREAIRG